MGDGDQGPEQLLFEPPSGSEVLKYLDEIPVYLFCVVSLSLLERQTVNRLVQNLPVSE